MPHASYNFFFLHHTRLFFLGVLLVHVEYVESGRVPCFTTTGFLDAEGEPHQIVVTEDDPDENHPGERLYAHVDIDGQTVKILEIWDGPHGRVYIEPGA